jgi:4-hydroxy-2-oxoheptanedioate aldolase
MGPYDLSGSMGHMGEPDHPEVRRAIEMVLSKARRTDCFVGMGVGDPDAAKEWVNKGVNWLNVSNDFLFLVKIASESIARAKKAIQ